MTDTTESGPGASTATSATWIRFPGYAAWFLLALLPLSVLMVRSGNWMQGLGIYALAGLLSLILLAVLAVFTLLPRWRSQRGALLKAALPALPGAALFTLAVMGQDVPAIHDITTDPLDPPQFEVVPTLRGPASNTLDLKPDSIEQQLAAYPEIRTLRSGRDYTSSYNLALTTARELGWEIVHEDPNAGFIEAVDSTTIMQFKDDIVIRVRSNEEGSLVDLRSVSRVGVSDLGANARRIRGFMRAFESAGARG